MCNLYRLETGPEAIRKVFSDRQTPLLFPEGIPNFQPRDIRITDPAPIIRAASNVPGGVELVQRRWSWPGAGGKPVYNYRAEGREFGSGRCLIVTDGFYEHTTPADPKQKRKDRWLFTLSKADWFCIAGLWRNAPSVGEAFTMLTVEAGPDVSPYHHRQVAVLTGDQWERWLDPAAPVKGMLGPLPGGTLEAMPAPTVDGPAPASIR
jgi:putative SOS response-associated peptidase YedK